LSRHSKFPGPWRKIKGLKDKSIQALLVRKIKLATDIQCLLLKCVYQKDNVIAVIVIPQAKLK
jgi:hypothetical protein